LQRAGLIPSIDPAVAVASIGGFGRRTSPELTGETGGEVVSSRV